MRAWTDVLLPADDDDLVRLGGVTWNDASATFRWGPVDLALVSAAEQLAWNAPAKPAAVVLAVPRGAHELAISVAAGLHVLRLRDLQRGGIFPTGLSFKGPTVIIGMDTAVHARLSQVRSAGTTIRGGLERGLGVHRVRSDGTLCDVNDAIVRDDGNPRLLYLNARIGWPTLPSHGGTVVIDRTSFRNDDALVAALQWALARRADLIVVVADLGDSEIAQSIRLVGAEPSVFPVTGEIAAELGELGAIVGAGPLTGNQLCRRTFRPSVPAVVPAPGEIEELIEHGIGCIRAGRRIGEPPPPDVARTIRVFNALLRCPTPLDDFDQVAATDPYIHSFTSLVNSLPRAAGALSGPWRPFGAGAWGTLLTVTRELAQSLRRQNHRYLAVLDRLDQLSRDDEPARVTIRVPNRVAAEVLTATLAGDLPQQSKRLAWSVVPSAARLPWAAERTCVLHTSLPAPWNNSAWWSAEATEGLVLAYGPEVPVLAYLTRELPRVEQHFLEQIFERVSAEGAPKVTTPLTPPPPAVLKELAKETDGAFVLPDLDAVLERAREIREMERESELVAELAPDSGTALVRAVRIDLGGGRQWWVRSDAEVDVLIGQTYRRREAVDLRSGDSVVVPRNAARETLFARLIAASRQSREVADLDILLRRFRKACWRLRTKYDSWAGAEEQLRRARAEGHTQVKAWATGDTIAPNDPHDIEIVARLAGDDALRSSWAASAAAAEMMRKVRQDLGRLLGRALEEQASGKPGRATGQLVALLGPGANEIIDEFFVAQVLAVSGPTLVERRRVGIVERSVAA